MLGGVNFIIRTNVCSKERSMEFELTFSMVAIVVVGMFISSILESIAGAGGIISVPVFLMAGLPMHMALGTNKLAASVGSLTSLGRFVKNGYIDWKLGIPSTIVGLMGAVLGTELQLLVPAEYLEYLLLLVLPIVAVFVFRTKKFPETTEKMNEKKRMAIILVSSFILGGYNGFYGPGMGTFLILAYCILAKIDIRTTSGNVKLISITSGIASLVTSALNGQVFWILGLIGAAVAMIGNFVGTGLTIKKGSKVVLPVVIIALVMLAVKVVIDLL